MGLELPRNGSEIAVKRTVYTYAHHYHVLPGRGCVEQSLQDEAPVAKHKPSIIKSLKTPSSTRDSESWQKASDCTYSQARRDRKQSQFPIPFSPRSQGSILSREPNATQRSLPPFYIQHNPTAATQADYPRRQRTTWPREKQGNKGRKNCRCWFI